MRSVDFTKIEAHANIALQFSGGKDSLAVAHLLRPYWDRLTFYHLDAGDLLPEISELVAKIEREVPRFVRVASNSREWAKENGEPSDLVPYTGTIPSMMMGAPVRVSGRWDCCGHNLWLPMHERMLADGVTLVIRGTKACDMKKIPAVSGERNMGYELWLPIEDWSHAQVFAYLREIGEPICRVYESAVNAPECATCPAWWNESRASYLRKYHPNLLAIYAERLHAVAQSVLPIMDTLSAELAEVVHG